MKSSTKKNPHLEWGGLPCKVPTMEHLEESQVSRVHYSQNLRYLACIILRISHYSNLLGRKNHLLRAVCSVEWVVKDGEGEQYFETICCMLGNAKDARKSDGATHILFMINKQNLGTALRVLLAMFSSQNKVPSTALGTNICVLHSKKC